MCVCITLYIDMICSCNIKIIRLFEGFILSFFLETSFSKILTNLYQLSLIIYFIFL